MDDLVQIMKNNVVVSSLDVARNFHKRHDRVIQTIVEQYGDLHEFVEMFREGFYKDEYGRKQRVFYMNRDGFSLLVMGFTGRKALEWKMKYIKAFNYMEKLLMERQTESWIDARTSGKLVRRSLTDAIKDYVALALEQGHNGTARHAYSNFSRLVKKPFGERDNATTGQLATIAAMEELMKETIRPLVDAGQDAKAIYAACKAKAEAFAGLFIPRLNEVALKRN